MKNFHFNKIIIIQLLDDNDLSTGRKLWKDLKDFCFYKNIEIPIELKNIYSSDDFKEFLGNQEINIRKSGNIPILHIETHGDDDKEGLVFHDESFIHWNEFKDLCINVNSH